MRLKLEVLDQIKELNPLYIFIVTNQGGIEKGFVKESDFIRKAEYINYAIQEYTGINTNYGYCKLNDPDYWYRKPNIGLLDTIMRRNVLAIDEVEKEDCLMIGDASGKKGQYSDTDKKTAENFGIDYLDVEDFIRIDFVK